VARCSKKEHRAVGSALTHSNLGLSFLAPSGLAPKGLEDSAQGFNPGNHENKWFALDGREVQQMNLAPIVRQNRVLN
jgi:hypothetical protein